MKILSFDVGIKNLAYCLLNDTKIEDWGILNISIEKECNHINNKNKCCDKTATFKNDESFHLCTSHKLLKCYKDLKLKKIPKQKNNILMIGKRMVKILDDHPNFLNVNIVLIENQPALKNPTMKTIQMLLYSYFLIRGIMIDTNSIQNMEMVNARNKLKVYKGTPIKCDIKDKYKKNKYLAIQYCGQMIHTDSDKFQKLFNESKKKDDLADSYLQGIYWLEKIK